MVRVLDLDLNELVDMNLNILFTPGTFQTSSPQSPNMATTGASDIVVLVPQ